MRRAQASTESGARCTTPRRGPISCAVDGDLGNLEKATTDLLVSHQIIQADDHSIVREIQLKWCGEVEGVRVTIQPTGNS
ncbi:RusA family crossover junction endodeoxyribonuclease [Bradyrhizobium elkanii]|uniref:RusA family crossover junction endodeoxyribonuclease n=1 Tax=Bradyrhizobium elkanii TaxID=29448 RepID=UPI003B984A80